MYNFSQLYSSTFSLLRKWRACLHKKVDSFFSPNLLALMGEWTCFAIFECERIVQVTDMSMREFCSKGLIHSDRGLLCHEYPIGDNKSIWLGSILNDYKIVEPISETSAWDMRPIIEYENIRTTFLKNLNADYAPIFPSFLTAAYAHHDLPRTENVTFQSDAGCQPLIERFCEEGYMSRTETGYYWSENMRPLMLSLKFWLPKEKAAKEAKIRKQNQLYSDGTESAYNRLFQQSLRDENISPLIDFIKDHKAIQGHNPYWRILDFSNETVCENLIKMDFWDAIDMFSIPDKPQKDKSYRLKWFGASD